MWHTIKGCRKKAISCIKRIPPMAYMKSVSFVSFENDLHYASLASQEIFSTKMEVESKLPVSYFVRPISVASQFIQPRKKKNGTRQLKNGTSAPKLAKIFIIDHFYFSSSFCSLFSLIPFP